MSFYESLGSNQTNMNSYDQLKLQGHLQVLRSMLCDYGLPVDYGLCQPVSPPGPPHLPSQPHSQSNFPPSFTNTETTRSVKRDASMYSLPSDLLRCLIIDLVDSS